MSLCSFFTFSILLLIAPSSFLISGKSSESFFYFERKSSICYYSFAFWAMRGLEALI